MQQLWKSQWSISLSKKIKEKLLKLLEHYFKLLQWEKAIHINLGDNIYNECLWHLFKFFF